MGNGMTIECVAVQPRWEEKNEQQRYRQEDELGPLRSVPVDDGGIVQ
jgi:hypothetical protein